MDVARVVSGIWYGLVLLVLASPWAAGAAFLGWAGFGPGGAVGGLALVVFTVFGSTLGAEAILRRRFGARQEVLREGLSRTLSMACAGFDPPPRSSLVTIAPSDAPLAVAGRSWRGGGVIVVTRGLVELLTEAELRAVLDRATRLLESPTVLLATAAATLGGLPFNGIFDDRARAFVTPEGRHERGPLRFRDMLALLLLAPWCRYWNLLASRLSAAQPHPSDGEEIASAARKVGVWLRRWNPEGLPELEALSVLGRFPPHPLEGLLTRGYS